MLVTKCAREQIFSSFNAGRNPPIVKVVVGDVTFDEAVDKVLR